MLGDQWGVTTDEVRRRYPCDEVVRRPAVSAWRGVTVHAAPDRVWPWVAQIRFAPYSYDWLDNRGKRSPRVLLDVAPPVAGDPFSSSGGRPLGRILSVEPGRHVTGRIAGSVISYVLEPDGEHTRLLMKIVLRRGRLVGPLVCVGDLVMARRQLLNLKELAESSTAAVAG